MPLHVVELFVYPIKSARGIPLREARLERRGVALDRRWMLVDDDGTFLTQRTVPRLALLEVAIGTDHLAVRAPGTAGIEVPFAFVGGASRRTRVTVWDDACDAILAPEGVSRWFAEVLGLSCRLVHMPDDSLRQVDPAFSGPDDLVGFSDGFPLLLVTVASLEELNRRLDKPVPMDRFRPNVVVGGSEPFAEDAWKPISCSNTTREERLIRSACISRTGYCWSPPRPSGSIDD